MALNHSLIFMLSTSYSCQILMKLEFSQQIFEKSSNIKFHEEPFSGSRAVPCGRMDEQTDMTKLTVAFRNLGTRLERTRFCNWSCFRPMMTEWRGNYSDRKDNSNALSVGQASAADASPPLGENSSS